MKRRYLILAMSLGIGAALTGCGNLSAAVDVATSASITRNQAELVIQSTQTLQDLATSYMSGCVSEQSVTGLCKPEAIEAIHTALVATRQPRKNLVAFAQAHAGAQLGASGLYDALVAARDSLSSVLKQYGYAVPTT